LFRHVIGYVATAFGTTCQYFVELKALRFTKFVSE
jgi:hypothetical protein